MSSSAERSRRERLAVDARRAIQNARFWLDPGPYRDPDKAVEWAKVAAETAEEFRTAVEAEAQQDGENS